MDTKTDASKPLTPTNQESFSAMRDRIAELESSLLAEREKVDWLKSQLKLSNDALSPAQQEIHELRARLAAAQAAMKDSYRLVATQQSPNDLRTYELSSEDPCGYATPVKLDTSALAAAIAEATKPLVDALTKAGETFADIKRVSMLSGRLAVAKSCDIAEEYSKAALAKVGK
jgi:chromosome segregation ATPase